MDGLLFNDWNEHWDEHIEMRKTTFCIDCNQKVEYEVITYLDYFTVKGKNYFYTAQAAHCLKCGKELYVAEINDKNCEAREDAYYKECKSQSFNEENM